MLFYAAIALLVAVSAAAIEAVRRMRVAERENARLHARLERFELQLPNTETPRSVDVTALRRESQRLYAAVEADRSRDVLAYLLGDCRDAMGAEEAVLWCWNDSADALRPGDWSTEGPSPAFFNADAWGPMIALAMEDEEVKVASVDGVVHAAAAPLLLERVQVGVLSVSNRRGLSRSRDELKHWMPRLARQVAFAQDLLAVRLDYGRHLGQNRAILKAVEKLGSTPEGDAVARSLCETSADITGARGAALIRWDGEAELGELNHASPGMGLRTPAIISPESQVATQCRARLPRVIEDARGLSSARALYGIGRSVPDPRSVAIVPIIRPDRVLGALVLESDEVNYFSSDLSQPLSMLLAAAAGSLELAWSYGEVDRRSRTDPLTGLYNRAHFAEQLQERLDFADRYLTPVSLIMVDVDHFKRVNDTFGHEAGDAVLRQVSAIIQDGVRSTDMCFRYGGEELALLLPKATCAEASELADRLRQRIVETVAFHKGAAIPVTASFGVATYLDGVSSREKLFPQADEALYRAKADGRNCVRSSAVKLRTPTS
jgi:diguanylate cyclase (GGDEF)-like protein